MPLSQEDVDSSWDESKDWQDVKIEDFEEISEVIRELFQSLCKELNNIYSLLINKIKKVDDYEPVIRFLKDFSRDTDLDNFEPIPSGIGIDNGLYKSDPIHFVNSGSVSLTNDK